MNIVKDSGTIYIMRTGVCNLHSSKKKKKESYCYITEESFCVMSRKMTIRKINISTFLTIKGNLKLYHLGSRFSKISTFFPSSFN